MAYIRTGFFHPALYSPFVIFCYCGKGKPSDIKKFSVNFIDELNKLVENGIEIEGKLMHVKILCFVCDTPACAFTKCVEYHLGFFASEKCVAKGVRFWERTVYPSMDY